MCLLMIQKHGVSLSEMLRYVDFFVVNYWNCLCLNM